MTSILRNTYQILFSNKIKDNSVKIWGLFHGSIEKEAVNVLFDENELIEISKVNCVF